MVSIAHGICVQVNLSKVTAPGPWLCCPDRKVVSVYMEEHVYREGE